MNITYYNWLLDSGEADGLLKREATGYYHATTKIRPNQAPALAKLVYRLTREARDLNVIVLDRYDFPMFYRAEEEN